MKYLNLFILLIAFFVVSCKGTDPTPPYVYEANPHYSFGYAQFFGEYYNDFGNTNNVISLSLFSDSLKINEQGSLEGTGQYLFLEDVFIASTDIFLPNGTYTISDSGLPFTISPGKNDSVDNNVYTIGSTISYYEPNMNNSKLKLITSGTLTITRPDSIYTIVCNFKTNDKKDLTGSFSATLPYFNEALTTAIVRKKLRYIMP